MNLKIKFRESFRPFAPSVLRERVRDYFELDAESPYMLLVAPVQKERLSPMPEGERPSSAGIEQLNVLRSDIPAVTHVDYSARVQTVTRDDNPALLRPARARSRELTGCAVAREHVVQRPRRADRVHAGRRLPLLHAHGHGLPGARALPPRKTEQAQPLGDDVDWRSQYELD